MVRYWDKISQEPVTLFFSMPVYNIATGLSQFDSIDKMLTSHNIPWDNMVGYASDMALVMVGKSNSVLNQFLEKQHQLFCLGCLCHLSALCCSASLKKIPVSFDNLLIDIYSKTIYV